jgi:hypothetical protein
MVVLTRAIAQHAISAGGPFPEFLEIAMIDRGPLPEFVQRWKALLGFQEDYPLGITLCLEGQVLTASTQLFASNRPGAAQPNNQPVDFLTGTVGTTLSELLAYGRLVKDLEKVPFGSDCEKFGDGQLSLTRCESKTEIWRIYRKISDSVQQMLEVVIESYAECLRVAMRREVRERVNKIDFDPDYFKVVADQLGWNLLQRAKYLELNKGPTIDSFWIDFVGGKIPLTEGQQAEFISIKPAKEFRGLCIELVVNWQHLSRSQKIEVLHLRKTLDRTNFTDANCIELAISGGFPAEEYSALKLEYKQAKSDRKRTIFRLFLDRHWGKPF